MDKKKFSTFSYKLVQISPIMILVNSGAFLSISSWFCELTELIFVMIPCISSTGYPPTTQGIMGHVQVANRKNCYLQVKVLLSLVTELLVISRGTGESDESVINKQTALYSLKLLSRLLSNDYPGEFKEVRKFVFK